MFHKSVSVLASSLNAMTRSGAVTLATINTKTHLNLIVSKTEMTLTPDEAKKLRDLLIEAYPIEAAASSKYKVGDKVTYKTIVGYGSRGMNGRKGTVKAVKANEWYDVDFGHTLGQLVPVHSDYLTATPEPVTAAISTQPIKVGDRVMRTRSNWRQAVAGREYTVERVDGNKLWLVELAGPYSLGAFSLIHSEPVKNAGPVSGRYIVAALEGSSYAPNAEPYVHLTDHAANTEAERLAKEHGGTFHVFRATFEASREKPVIPPVKTTKL